MAKVKKPIYKKWWFWVVLVFFGIGALGASGDNDEDDIPIMETVVETPSRAIETPDEKGWRLSDEAAAEDAREQQSIAAIEEIPSEAVEEIVAPQPQEQPTRETPPAEPELAQEPVKEEAASEPVAPPVENTQAEPEPEPPKEPVKVSATVSGTSRTISLDSGSLVWLSATGEKFHSINNCGKMNPEKAYQVTIDYANSRGFDACEKCW